MPLGYLEEDNPLKAYFRFRPLFLHEDGRYHPFAEPEQQYPQDGFVRIVPDKNESSHFKARMRQLGRYCPARPARACGGKRQNPAQQKLRAG